MTMFDYDASIVELIDSVKADLLVQVPQATHIILTGSGGRGELSYLRVNDQIKLLSDLEFYVVVPQDDKVSKVRKDQIERHLSRKYKNSDFDTPFFSIDIDVVTREELVSLHTLLAFESLSNSSVLYGTWDHCDDPESPNRTIQQTDLHNVILYRHYAVLSALEWTSAEMSSTFNLYCINRNALDILTIITYYGDVRLPSYKARLQYLHNSCQQETKVFDELVNNNNFRQYMEQCLEYKLAPRLAYTDEEFISSLKSYLEYTEIVLTILAERHYGSTVNNGEHALALIAQKGSFFKRYLKPARLLAWRLYFYITNISANPLSVWLAPTNEVQLYRMHLLLKTISSSWSDHRVRTKLQTHVAFLTYQFKANNPYAAKK